MKIFEINNKKIGIIALIIQNPLEIFICNILIIEQIKRLDTKNFFDYNQLHKHLPV